MLKNFTFAIILATQIKRYKGDQIVISCKLKIVGFQIMKASIEHNQTKLNDLKNKKQKTNDGTICNDGFIQNRSLK